MAKPKLLGVDYAAKAKPILDAWIEAADSGTPTDRRRARAKLKSLRMLEARALVNPLTAGNPVAREKWPADLGRDYGPDIPNLFRFELADRWRGYYTLIGEPGGARIWVLYLWAHSTYDRQSGYAKK